MNKVFAFFTIVLVLALSTDALAQPKGPRSVTGLRVERTENAVLAQITIGAYNTELKVMGRPNFRNRVGAEHPLLYQYLTAEIGITGPKEYLVEFGNLKTALAIAHGGYTPKEWNGAKANEVRILSGMKVEAMSLINLEVLAERNGITAYGMAKADNFRDLTGALLKESLEQAITVYNQTGRPVRFSDLEAVVAQAHEDWSQAAKEAKPPYETVWTGKKVIFIEIR